MFFASQLFSYFFSLSIIIIINVALLCPQFQKDFVYFILFFLLLVQHIIFYTREYYTVWQCLWMDVSEWIREHKNIRREWDSSENKVEWRRRRRMAWRREVRAIINRNHATDRVENERKETVEFPWARKFRSTTTRVQEGTRENFKFQIQQQLMLVGKANQQQQQLITHTNTRETSLNLFRYNFFSFHFHLLAFSLLMYTTLLSTHSAHSGSTNNIIWVTPQLDLAAACTVYEIENTTQNLKLHGK